MEGRTELIKIAEYGLAGQGRLVRKWMLNFIENHPESDLNKPFEALLKGVKNPDALKLQTPQKSENEDIYRLKYEKCIKVIKRFDAGIIGMYDL